MIRIDRRQWLLWLGLFGWCGLWIAFAYHSTLRLAFVTDDWTQLPYAASRTVAEIWQGARGPAYYRPLAFTIWKIVYVILGRHDEMTLHALNLTLHGLNSLVVGWLAGRLWQPSSSGKPVEWLRRYLAAGLFALFPFSYDAIVWIAAMMHPLAITLILLSVAAYVKAREGGSWRWSALSLGLVFLSPFAHEYGVLASPLCLAVELTWPRAVEPLWRRVSRAALWLIPLLIWWLIWRGMPIPRGAGWLALNSGTTLWRNSVYFLQGAAYPITWSGSWLSERLVVDNVGVAIGLAVSALAGAALVQWRRRADRRAWLPWLWLTLASAPAILFLNYKYVINSPRMLMLMSVGAAWLWADVAVRLAQWRQTALSRQRLSQAVIGLCAIALMLQNVALIHDRLWPWTLASSVVRQIVERTVAANTAGEQAVFINLPAWIASSQVVYAVGQEGLMLLPEYFPIEMVVAAYTGQPGRAVSIKNEAIRSEVPYYYIGLRDSTTDWPNLAKAGGQVFVTNYAPDGVNIQPAGVLRVDPPATEALVRFNPSIVLYTGLAAATSDGVQVELTWQVTQPLPDDVTVFVHVLDANGQLIAQADGDPLAGAYPFVQWPIDLIVRDIRVVNAPGAAAVRVGVYSRTTDERLTAIDADSNPLADNAVTIPMH